jgi:isopentenyl-diphosphate delta-isomerase
MAKSEIEERKADHLEVAASGRADFRAQTTLLEQVQLVHQSLPELRVEDIDLGVELLGHRLDAPIVVTGMTGGTQEARKINRDIARAAQQMNVAFGVGSQRAMAEDDALTSTYEVRDVAPDLLLIGNIGAVQAAAYGSDRVRALAERLGASAMAVHLNPAQEMIQRGGDRDFGGALRAIEELVKTLEIPLIVKETGCGISKQSARQLVSAGVQWVDVSGAGGTSWVAVERHRAQPGTHERQLGDELWDWGLPTAVSVALCAAEGLQVVASGGMRSGLDIARAIALGARAGGMAAPILRAQRQGGSDAVLDTLRGLMQSLKTVHLLCGAASVDALAASPRYLAPPLRSWIDALA